MVCPNCSKENVSAFGYCVGCQKPLSTVGGAAAMPALAPVTDPASRVMGVPARVFLVITSLVALAVAILKPVDPGDATMQMGEHVGVLLALVGIPALIAYLVAGWKKVRHPNRFVLVFCVISGVFSLGNAASTLNMETQEQRFTRLMREAAGTQPISRKGFPSERRLDDAVRTQYGKLLQQNRDYMSLVKSMDNSKLKDINTAKAFASADVAQPALEQLHALYDVDAAHERDVQATLSGLRHVFDDVKPETKREAMYKGFDGSIAQQNIRRQQVLALEKLWVDAVDDEHAFAADHRGSMHLAEASLVIDDPAIRAEFNDKMRLQEEERKAFLKAQAEFSKAQAGTLEKMGLSSKDVGTK
jgi:hypothetical protein